MPRLPFLNKQATSMFNRIVFKQSRNFASNRSGGRTFLGPRVLLSACLVLTTATSFVLNNNNNINNKYHGGLLRPSLTTTSLCEGATSAFEKDKFAGTALFPPLEAYFKGMLQVSDKHTIAYSIYGNPNGKPILYVHGGPGGGTDPAVSILLIIIIVVVNKC